MLIRLSFQHPLQGRVNPFFLNLTLLTVLILSGLLFSPFATLSADARTVPALPREIHSGGNQPVLLEFYATWCTTCQKMFPYLTEMKRKAQGKLKVIRLDIDDPVNKPWVKLYRVQGTPTYFLYDQTKKPVYVMEDMISSKLLETMVSRETGVARNKPVPAKLKGKVNLLEKPYTFVAYHQSQCSSCEPGRSLANTLQSQFSSSLNVVELNRDRDSGAEEWMKQLPIRKMPAYVLMDNRGYFIYSLEQPVNAKNQWQMMQVIQMTLKGQP